MCVFKIMVMGWCSFTNKESMFTKEVWSVLLKKVLMLIFVLFLAFIQFSGCFYMWNSDDFIEGIETPALRMRMGGCILYVEANVRPRRLNVYSLHYRKNVYSIIIPGRAYIVNISKIYHNQHFYVTYEYGGYNYKYYYRIIKYRFDKHGDGEVVYQWDEPPFTSVEVAVFEFGNHLFMTSFKEKKQMNNPNTLFYMYNIKNISEGKEYINDSVILGNVEYIERQNAILYSSWCDREKVKGWLVGQYAGAVGSWPDIPCIKSYNNDTQEIKIVNIGQTFDYDPIYNEILISSGYTRYDGFRIVKLMTMEWRDIDVPRPCFQWVFAKRDNLLLCYGRYTKGSKTYRAKYGSFKWATKFYPVKIVDLQTGQFYTVLPVHDYRAPLTYSACDGKSIKKFIRADKVNIH